MTLLADRSSFLAVAVLSMQTSEAIVGWLVYKFILCKKAIEADALLVVEAELALSIYMMPGGFYANTLIFANSPSRQFVFELISWQSTKISCCPYAKLSSYKVVEPMCCQTTKMMRCRGAKLLGNYEVHMY